MLERIATKKIWVSTIFL